VIVGTTVRAALCATAGSTLIVGTTVRAAVGATAGSTLIVGTTVRTAVCATAGSTLIVGTTVRTAVCATAGCTFEVAACEIAGAVTVDFAGAGATVISTLFTSSTDGSLVNGLVTTGWIGSGKGAGVTSTVGSISVAGSNALAVAWRSIGTDIRAGSILGSAARLAASDARLTRTRAASTIVLLDRLAVVAIEDDG
jgi:hypothetical protein